MTAGITLLPLVFRSRVQAERHEQVSRAQETWHVQTRGHRYSTRSNSLLGDNLSMIGTSLKIEVPQPELNEFCKRWGITKLEVFGSAIRDDFNPETSDVDLLMTLGPNPPEKLSLLDLVGMERELTDMFGKKVDLLTRSSVEDDHNEIRKKAILNQTKIISE